MSYDDGSSHARGSRHSQSGYWEDEDNVRDVEMSWEDVEGEEVGEDKSENEFDEPERYEVESVISRKVENGKEKFLIQWKGYSKPTWEPRENLDDCALLLDSFYKVAKDTEPEALTLTGVPTDDDFKQKLLEAHQSSMHLNIELYDKLILKRGVKDTSDIGPKIETVPIVSFGGIIRQNSTSSNSSRGV
ncbi:chromobox protein-like 3-like [Gigaspora margarita]|uniref:Chromobox protein-like 3-like n=1 Tax=Gigaspora margarita TaxID=4874 RepID=A0A8H4AEA1_GIGMA|nr:chromobox protein-like 3-like [Gigaspora margarita]